MIRVDRPRRSAERELTVSPSDGKPRPSDKHRHARDDHDDDDDNHDDRRDDDDDDNTDASGSRYENDNARESRG